MITVNYMKPHSTKRSGKKLRLIFAYQYFAIEKDDEVYHFIPIEGKEIVVNLEYMQVENMSEVFVFQKGNKFLRLPIYQLLLVSDVTNYLNQFTEGHIGGAASKQDYHWDGYKAPSKSPSVSTEEDVPAEIQDIVSILERNNLQFCIDQALDAGDKELFLRLSSSIS